jgi:glycosyltransferase involved in cell wall biosynthesis
LLSSLTEAAPDVIHVHGIAYPLQLAWLHTYSAAPIVVQDHATRLPHGLRRLACRWALRHVSGVAFTAREQARPFIEHDVIRRDMPVFEIPEGTSRFTPGDRTAARVAAGVYGDPCLVWLGNLDENKDPLTVLAALSRARAALPDPHLWCCFRAAPLLERVRHCIEHDPALAGRVHLLGAKSHDEVEQVLRAADFFIQGSHREGSGYALIEALACGTPGIVTDIPPFRRLTGDGRVAALSPPGDAGAMAAAIVSWSRQDRSAQRQAARTHFERTLSLDAIGWAWRRAYEALLQERAA